MYSITVQTSNKTCWYKEDKASEKRPAELPPLQIDAVGVELNGDQVSLEGVQVRSGQVSAPLKL